MKYEYLLDWYASNKRTLPWRNTKDPYMIWLSEIMLQQTQVNVVIPYYNRWIKTFPTIEKVAKADLDNLLKLWEGLGYYSRCRNFHKASQYVVTNYKGIIPRDYDLFIALPGVGEYIASAVMSIAYDQSYPAIDGNLKRVISRYLGLRKITKRNLFRIKKKLNTMIQINPGDINQALMDIGSSICKSTIAKCSICPLNITCKAASSLDATQYPEKKKKKSIPTKHFISGYISYDNYILITKRPSTGLLAGLWELPMVEYRNDSKLIDVLNDYTTKSLGCGVNIINKIGVVKHAYSHYKICITLFKCEPKNINVKNSQWIHLNEIDDFTFSKANHKLFNSIGIIND